MSDGVLVKHQSLVIQDASQSSILTQYMVLPLCAAQALCPGVSLSGLLRTGPLPLVALQPSLVVLARFWRGELVPLAVTALALWGVSPSTATTRHIYRSTVPFEWILSIFWE